MAQQIHTLEVHAAAKELLAKEGYRICQSPA
jgi:hypothetical protein